MKKTIKLLLLYLLLICIIIPAESYAQKVSRKGSNTFGSSPKTKNTKKNNDGFSDYGIKTEKIKTKKDNTGYFYKPERTKKEKVKDYTYEESKTPKTTYENGKNYKTTGYTKVKRSKSNVRKFLKQYGLKKVPNGYEVDHIRPLSEGGSDTPDNMQLITKSYHKMKTAKEKSSHKKTYVYKNQKQIIPQIILLKPQK